MKQLIAAGQVYGHQNSCSNATQTRLRVPETIANPVDIYHHRNATNRDNYTEADLRCCGLQHVAEITSTLYTAKYITFNIYINN